MQLERRILASLYFLAKESVPSPTKLKRLALRLAIDARKEIHDHYSYDVFSDDNDKMVVQRITIATPFTPAEKRVIRVYRVCQKLDPPELVVRIEQRFVNPPDMGETLESNSPARFVYSVDGERIRLWIAGNEVHGVHRKDVQELLKHLVKNPYSQIPGRQLERKSEKRLKNASLAGRVLRNALRTTLKEANSWYVPRPPRWAEGIAPSLKRDPTPE